MNWKVFGKLQTIYRALRTKTVIRYTWTSFLLILCTSFMMCQIPVFGIEPIRVWFSHIEAENEEMRSIAKAFTETTGIPVEIISRRAIFDAPADLVNNAELPDRPDVILMQAPDIGGLVASGYLLPLSVDRDLRERFVGVAFDAFTISGTAYGIGYSIDTSGLLYNKALIDPSDLPKTWDDFFSLAKSLTKMDDQGQVVQFGTRLNPKDMWFLYPIIQEYGGYYYGTLPDGTHNAYDIGLDNEGMLQYVKQMKQAMTHNLTITNPNHTESHISMDFARGRVAMILYGLWNAQIYQNMGLDYGIAMLPRHHDGSDSQPFSTIQGFVVNRFTNNEEAAIAFLDFILYDDHQQILIEAGNRGDQKTGERNPSNKAVIASPYVQTDTILQSLTQIGQSSQPFPNIPEGTIWYNYTPTAFRTIFFGDQHGQEVDPQIHLRMLTDRIRSDVALMNQTPEHIVINPQDIVLPIILIGGAGVVGFFVISRKRNKRIQDRLSMKETAFAWIILLPLLLMLGIFYVYPIVHNFYLSLTDYSGINLRDYGLIGTANFHQIFTTQIRGLAQLTIWTIAFATLVVGISFLLGTFLATLLDRISFSLARIYRVIFILPWVVPAFITLLMWQGLLETEGGMVNQLLGLIGLPGAPWLSHPIWARVSVVLVMTAFSFPYYMVLVLGLLKTIPKSFFDVACIEGANGFQIFHKITLPWVFRAMLPMLIMGLIMQMNQFGVYLLTQGGPFGSQLGAPGATDLLITYVFNTAFNTKRYSLAAAYAVIIFLFVGSFALGAMALGKKKTAGEQA